MAPDLPESCISQQRKSTTYDSQSNKPLASPSTEDEFVKRFLRAFVLALVEKPKPIE